MPVTIELPVRPDQTEYNLQRWAEVMDDPHYATLDGSFETDRHGNVIHMPPPGFRHARLQRRIATTLSELMGQGETATECPISTADGVKAADVVWLSVEQLAQVGNNECLPFSPLICVEVKSPRNSWRELEDKRTLYFEAGCLELWICDERGKMRFFAKSGTGVEELNASRLCPGFPREIVFPASPTE
jgi:Uma2 family endonuclease